MRTQDIVTYVGLCLCSAFGCRSSGDTGAVSSSVSTTTTAGTVVSVKKGTEQTEGPTDSLKYPSESPPRPTPTVVFQTPDLTSSIGSTPLIVSVESAGVSVGRALLDALAAQLRLEEANGATVAFTTQVQDASGSTLGPGGFPTDPMAKVVVVPSAPLSADKWYALRLQKMPVGLSLPRYAQFQTLPDGAPGVRVSPGSHARPTAIRVCEKAGGMSAVMVDWSERVENSPGPSAAAVSETSSGLKCPLDNAAVPGPSSTAYRFLCQGLPKHAANVALDLDVNIRSASGSPLDVPAPAGRLRHNLAVDLMTEYGEGCRIARPW